MNSIFTDILVNVTASGWIYEKKHLIFQYTVIPLLNVSVQTKVQEYLPVIPWNVSLISHILLDVLLSN